MKIVMCCINPIFPDKVIGGSTKELQRIATYLAELGHRIVVLCTRRDASQDGIFWHENIDVRAVFEFKQPFPLPYDIPGFQMARIIQHIVDASADADRLYFHDGEILYPPLAEKIPTVTAIHDLMYPETMLGGFLFAGDELITLNEYGKKTILATAGRFVENLAERVHVVPNGFDFERFKPTPPSAELLDLLQINPAEHTIVLHPHRPELTKGLRQTIETADLLVRQHGIENLKVLVPCWFDADGTPDISEYLHQIQKELQERGLAKHFIFHPWLPQRLMPEYFSLGRVTFVLGSFVEAFGNIAYESLACGTPVVLSGVGCARDLVPDELLPKFNFNDIEWTATIAALWIRSNTRTSPELLKYLKTHFNELQQCQGYANIILNARKRPPIRHRLEPITDQTTYVMPPWCGVTDLNTIYHDHLAQELDSQRLVDISRLYPAGATLRQMQLWGAGPDEIQAWIARGFLVPSWN